MARESERQVKIVSPDGAEATICLESVPVYFDLGWQKAEGEDYGVFTDLQPARLETEATQPRQGQTPQQAQQQALAAKQAADAEAQRRAAGNQ